MASSDSERNHGAHAHHADAEGASAGVAGLMGVGAAAGGGGASDAIARDAFAAAAIEAAAAEVVSAAGGAGAGEEPAFSFGDDGFDFAAAMPPLMRSADIAVDAPAIFGDDMPVYRSATLAPPAASLTDQLVDASNYGSKQFAGLEAAPQQASFSLATWKGDAALAPPALEREARHCCEAHGTASDASRVGLLDRLVCLARSAPVCPDASYPFARFSFWHVAHVPVSAPVTLNSKTSRSDLQTLLSELSAALRGAGAELSFDAQKCKFKGVCLVDGTTVTFRARVYSGTPQAPGVDGYSIELQKRSGDSLMWHDLFSRVVCALPAELRPARFAKALPKRCVVPELPEEDAVEDDGVSQVGGTSLLAMVDSSSIDMRRQAAGAVATLAKNQRAAVAFAEDGTVAKMSQIVSEGGRQGADALITAMAAAALANVAVAAAGVVASSELIRNVVPALLAIVDGAAREGMPQSDSDLECMVMRRECGRALAELANDRACASKMEAAANLAKLTHATMSCDEQLVGFAQSALSRVVSCTC